MLAVYLCATYCSPDYPRYMTNNCSRSVYAHFWGVVECMSLFVLNIKAANIYNNDSEIPMSILCE